MKDILEYKGFWSKINYEEETSTYWGVIEEIEDGISFESDTKEGLEQEFKEVVEEYIEDCKEILHKDPYQHTKNNKEEKQNDEGYSVTIEPDIHQKATEFAASFNMSLNQFVTKAICDEIEACEKQIN